MGKIVQRTKLFNHFDWESAQMGIIADSNIRQVEVDLLVDTGAAMICLTPEVITRLGLRKQQERDVITGNGQARRGIYSPVRIQIFDREADLNVMEIPPGTPLLMGYLALEALDLYPNPKKHVLEGNPQYGGKMVIDCLVSVPNS